MRAYDHIVLNQAVSGTVYSEPVDVQHLTFLSYQVTVNNGTLSASATLQLSNDGVNFVDDSATTKSFSGVGSIIQEVVDVCVRYVRVKLTYTSGTSDVTITLVSKGNS